MPETGYLVAAVGVAVAVTWALRALPFAVLGRLRRSPLVSYLNAAMPAGVMIILAAYTLRDLGPGTPPNRAWPTVLALAVTVALHLWRRNVPLSVLAGTAVHVILASTLFAD